MRNFGQSGLPDGGRKGFFVCLLLALVVESVGSRGEAAGVSALTAQVVSAAFGVNEAQAAICFLPDCMDKLEDLKGDPSVGPRLCRRVGYSYYPTGFCPAYQEQETCPHHSFYLKCDAALWCRNNGYTTTECTVPEYLDEQCPNGLNVYKGCKLDYERACEEENSNYVTECQDGWQLDPNYLCTYSPAYGLCCNICNVFPYLESDIPYGYVKDESCYACGGVNKYSIKPNPCTGYQKCDDGPKSGSPSCQHGDETWYKECCGYECSLESCPHGTECRLEICSNRYCITGCSTNFTDYCIRPVEDCSSLGYVSTSCTGESLVCPYDISKLFCI